MRKWKSLQIMLKVTAFLIALSLCVPAIGKTIYVDADAAGANNGSSWADAYNYLQDALADANTAEKPAEILVTQGIYRPDQGATMTSGDRSETFQLISGVAILGGYASVGEPRSDARDIELYETILSGDLDGNDTDVNYAENPLQEPYKADNSYQVVTGSRTDETAILDGFTITSGYANIYTNRNGAGLLNQEGSPRISNCTFIHNTAQYFGGGIYNYYSSPIIVNCTFVQNSAQDKGGGIYNYQSSPILTNCTFNDNSARNDGGGIHNSRGSPGLADCTFSANSSRQGGGIYNDDSSAALVNCVFMQNSAEDKGGAIYSFENKPSLNNCTFSGNSAEYGGGGICFHSSDPNLTDCTFSENSASYGGGIYNQGSDPILTNCMLIANSGHDCGGGMYNTGGNPTLNNCIVTANRANSYGGGMSCNNSDLTLTNCTFTENSAPNGNTIAFNSREQRGQSTAGLIACIVWDGADAFWTNDRSTMLVSFSDVQGGWPGDGNLDADPLFVDPQGPDKNAGTEDDDLRLAPLSPCIDAGDPGYAPGPSKKDLDGNLRIVSGRVDMGAYEFQGIIYVGDDVSDNPLRHGSERHPFGSIQEAIDLAKDGYKVLVKPGLYDKIDFSGKATTVTGIDGAAVIDGSTATRGGSTKGEQDAVTFHTGEGPGSVLKNFVIRNSGMAISLNYGSSPTISNITIVNNNFGIAAYEDSNPRISNVILWNNRDGDLFQCDASYSCVESGAPGEGNISSDPLFVDAANGDYHLLSQGWYWSMQAKSWTYDENVTSPCTDAGNPASPLYDEPLSVPRDVDNRYGVNMRINMGAYGGTSQASMPPLDWIVPKAEMVSVQSDPTQ
jgi:parallel beta-helix repeat protein/predicted outer membrane repeat protein